MDFVLLVVKCENNTRVKETTSNSEEQKYKNKSQLTRLRLQVLQSNLVVYFILLISSSYRINYYVVRNRNIIA